MGNRCKAHALATLFFCLLVPAVCCAEPHTVTFRNFQLTISESQTAQLFHIVDQLSQWDQYSHRQYFRWAAKALPLDDDDDRFLQQQVELRRRYGWGSALEKAFLVEETPDIAARNAVQTGLLTEAEAIKERDVLKHFAPRLAPLINQQKPVMDRFIRQLEDDRNRLAPTIAELLAFCEVKMNINVPVFVVANPDKDNGGGEANAGRLIIEVPSPDARSVLLHESLHALLAAHQEEIQAVAKTSGIDGEVLNEAIAYAFAPGLTDDGTDDDQLADEIVRLQLRGAKPSDRYLKFYSMAIVVRPVLRQSLREHEAFSTFLSKAVQKMKATGLQ